MGTGPSSTLPVSAPEIVRAVLGADRRVLLVGQAGIGKSTLAGALAEALAQAGRPCGCIGADPGSPPFGVPGAAGLARWSAGAWQVTAMESLCTLDAGRFRLPLVSAVHRLAPQLPSGTLLVDGPGVVRGVAGAELVQAMIEATGTEVVLALAREGRPLPLARELSALPVEVYRVAAAAEARRPGKRTRGRARTRLWDAYLQRATEQTLDLGALALLGTPPPRDQPGAWQGRQIALIAGDRTLALGEVTGLDGNTLRAKLPPVETAPTALLVRDAQRLTDGRLGTAPRFTPEPLDYYPPPAATSGGPRVAGRVGMLDVTLVNGVFGDPLLHLRLRHQRRSLLFDLGEGTRLSARTAHQISDVFISHAHIDHIGGFLWLLRSRIGDFPPCRLYGPPGLAENIAGLTRGILWDRLGDRGPRFVVSELHGEHIRRYTVQAGHPDCTLLDECAAADGVLHAEPGFRVRAATLEHVSPVLAFAFEPARQLNVRKDRLEARGLEPGAWLGDLKRAVLGEHLAAPIRVPDGATEPAKALADDLLLIRPGRKLAYATDFSDSADNRRRVIDLARGAHTFFCESPFLEADSTQARRTAHLTTRACGEIAESAGVARLVPFHFSRRYEHDPSALYEEIEAICTRVVTPAPTTVFTPTP